MSDNFVDPSDPEEPLLVSGLPTVDELIAETKVVSTTEAQQRQQDEDDFEEDYELRSIKAARAWAHLKGLEDHYNHKGVWSWFLGLLLAGMIVFQWILLAMVGLGKWDFTKYQWLLPILLVQNLGQIIGLALIVVKSLFKDLDHEK